MSRLNVGIATDVGLVRSNNQDNYLVLERVVIVADGMGGHAGGEVASEIAVRAIESSIEDGFTSADLALAVQAANHQIVHRAEDEPELHGMGTTVTGIGLVEDSIELKLAVVNVGDSRVYVLHDGELNQITVDHSLVEDLVRKGRITRDEAEVHPQRNILTRSLGQTANIEVDSQEYPAEPGDRFLICSDGLFNEVSESRLRAALRRFADPQEAADELVRLALAGGGRDNVTVAVVDVADDDGNPAFVAGLTTDDEVDEAAIPTEKSDPASGLPDEPPVAKRGGVPWLTIGFVVAVVVVLGAAAALVGVLARGTYFVGFADDEVAIYKGRPGGVLWFDPTIEERTGIDRADVPAAAAATIESGKDEPSLTEARLYVEQLREQIDNGGTGRPSGSLEPVPITLPPLGDQAARPGCPATDQTQRITSFLSPPPTCLTPGDDLFAIVTTDFGDIVFDLAETRAQTLVNNFVFLAGWNAYDGVAFHFVTDTRLSSGDMNGPIPEGEPGYTLDGDTAGVASAGWNLVQATTADEAGLSGSRFDLVLLDVAPDETPPGLGKLVSGQDVLERIIANAGGRDDGQPTLSVSITDITIVLAADVPASPETTSPETTVSGA